MRAKDVMSDRVMSIGAEATALEAIELLVRTRVSAMPVVDAAGVMIGIVSEADLIGHADLGTGAIASELLQRLSGDDAHRDTAAPAFARARALSVTDVMTRNVLTADENASLADVAELMLKHGVKRLPLLRDGAVVGIVSRTDLLQAMVPHGRPAAANAAGVGSQLSNEELRQAVSAALRASDWGRAQRRDVVVNSGVVHLWGVVESDELEQAYSAAVAQVPGVVSVQSHMHVVPS